MSTKPPSKIKPVADAAIEKIAYASVADIPTAEPHDRDRLGYGVWRWLTMKRDTLEQSVRTANAKLLIGEEEAMQRIRASLKQQGIEGS